MVWVTLMKPNCLLQRAALVPSRAGQDEVHVPRRYLAGAVTSTNR
jgi:hypothetical protein